MSTLAVATAAAASALAAGAGQEHDCCCLHGQQCGNLDIRSNSRHHVNAAGEAVAKAYISLAAYSFSNATNSCVLHSQRCIHCIFIRCLVATRVDGPHGLPPNAKGDKIHSWSWLWHLGQSNGHQLDAYCKGAKTVLLPPPQKSHTRQRQRKPILISVACVVANRRRRQF